MTKCSHSVITNNRYTNDKCDNRNLRLNQVHLLIEPINHIRTNKDTLALILNWFSVLLSNDIKIKLQHFQYIHIINCDLLKNYIYIAIFNVFLKSCVISLYSINLISIYLMFVQHSSARAHTQKTENII